MKKVLAVTAIALSATLGTGISQANAATAQEVSPQALCKIIPIICR